MMYEVGKEGRGGALGRRPTGRFCVVISVVSLSAGMMRVISERN